MALKLERMDRIWDEMVFMLFDNLWGFCFWAAGSKKAG
jgi:hypothetical protein